MAEQFSDIGYSAMIEALFNRFPSFQKVGTGAYKPGMDNMYFMDQLLGHPHKKYNIIHIAGTNGKGSVSNMLASVLSALGFKVGLYTSPHILDFRERIRVCNPEGELYTLISKEAVWDFIQKWNDTFDHLDMSFFEITTSMALDWFAAQEVDYVVLETGLGGRLDSTNIVTPRLSVITNIGLDHCDLLGDTLQEIAFEKAGIIKQNVPVVVGESSPETDPVFDRKVYYTNISSPEYMGDRKRLMGLLTYADKLEPVLWERSGEILSCMDLKGSYQVKNLRTAMAALGVLFSEEYLRGREELVAQALINTAGRTGFSCRWETVSENPFVICDIGHNEHGLKYNFSQLSRMLQEGECSRLIIVYGSVSDKDVDSVIEHFPGDAVYVFTNAQGKRALPADDVREKYLAMCSVKNAEPCEHYCYPAVCEAVKKAVSLAEETPDKGKSGRPLIYVGGSTYVVSEALKEIL